MALLKNDWITNNQYTAADQNNVANAVNNSTQTVNILNYGAVGNGTTDNATAINNAITAANTAGLPVFVPPGRFAIGSTLTMAQSTRIFGARTTGHIGLDDTPNVSELYALSGLAGPMITGPQVTYDVRISDLFLNCDANNANSYGISIVDNTVEDESNWYIDHVTVARAGLDGIYIGTKRMGNKIRDCQIMYCGRDGLSVNASDCGIDCCTFGTHTRYGIHLNGTMTRISNCDLWNCEVGIFIAAFQNNSHIIGCGIDRHKHEGVYLANGAYNHSISSCYFHSNSQLTDATYSHIEIATTAHANCLTLMGNSFDSDGTGKDPQYVLHFAGAGTGACAYGNTIDAGATTTGTFSNNAVTNNF